MCTLGAPSVLTEFPTAQAPAITLHIRPTELVVRDHGSHSARDAVVCTERTEAH
jgi:hypothetical protein